MTVNPMTVFPADDISLEEVIAQEKEARMYEYQREEGNTYDV